MPHIEKGRFEPAKLSIEECLFLLDGDNLEKPPVAIRHMLQAKRVPGVNPAAVLEIVGALYERQQLQSHEGVIWQGFDAIRESIQHYLTWHEQTLEIYRRSGGPGNSSAIRHAGMYDWADYDGSSRPPKFAIGADAAEMVRTRIDEHGQRIPLGLNLDEPTGGLHSNLAEVAPWLRVGGAQAKLREADAIIEKRQGRHGRFVCSVCGKAEEFDTASRTTRALAHARMGRHLKNATREVSRHRLLATRFGRGKRKIETAEAPEG